MLEFYREREATARKIHFCDACGDMIGSGHRYNRTTAKYDGDFFDIKRHLECAAIVNVYCGVIDENEYDPDDVRNWIREDVCCDLCTEEERDDCLRNPFLCPKVLAKLNIEKED